MPVRIGEFVTRQDGAAPPRSRSPFVKLQANPLLDPSVDRRLGLSLAGPSLLRVTAAGPTPDARYHLYFAHHRGRSIRLATSDHISGPWEVTAAPLKLAQTPYRDHLASPDVVVDPATGQLRMYFHGGDGTALNRQSESVAISSDGLAFKMAAAHIGPPYWRVFLAGGYWFALAMPGRLLRSETGLGNFSEGPSVLPARARHSALAVVENTLLIFYSQIGDCPESIRLATVPLRSDWLRMEATYHGVVIEPELPCEGIDFPTLPSRPGRPRTLAREVRDPAVLVERGTLYLVYAGGGERALCIAQAPAASLLRWASRHIECG